MRNFIRRLRGLGPVGATAADIITFLTTNWVLTMSTIVAIWAALNEWATAIVHDVRVQTALEVFLALLWSVVGLLYLVDRKRPRLTRPAPDYRYGLTFEGIAPSIDTMSDEGWFGLLIQLRNFSQAPIHYTVDSFDFRIGSRALPKSKKVLDGYLARGGGKSVCPSRFKRDELKEFFGRRVEGTAELSIIYGHPEEPPVRRLKIVTNITLHFPLGGDGTAENPFGFGADILGESDEPLDAN
jgi:hypothetical protein